MLGSLILIVVAQIAKGDAALDQAVRRELARQMPKPNRDAPYVKRVPPTFTWFPLPLDYVEACLGQGPRARPLSGPDACPADPVLLAQAVANSTEGRVIDVLFAWTQQGERPQWYEVMNILSHMEPLERLSTLAGEDVHHGRLSLASFLGYWRADALATEARVALIDRLTADQAKGNQVGTGLERLERAQRRAEGADAGAAISNQR